MESKQIYLIFADIVLLMHFTVAIFIVLGLVLILIGGLRGWRWIRNRLFRYSHLAAICLVVIQAWLGRYCPLTDLENSLRIKAGEAGYSSGFIAHWVSQLLYYDFPLWMFTVTYTLFGLLVLACWIKFRPDF